MARKQRMNFCGSPEHGFNRRGFLRATAAAGATTFASDMTILDCLKNPALADEVKSQQKTSFCSGWPAVPANWKRGIQNPVVRPGDRIAKFRRRFQELKSANCCPSWPN